ncbi:MAG: DUF4159 domain-containing protein [Candidatus Poribacteria bacterium]|nr:DUF4159 domain-containing protein [Candidatus Poribacteria bacterium]
MNVLNKIWKLIKRYTSKPKLFVCCCLLFCVVISTQHAGELFTIAQIQYGGGGDWYGDPSTIGNWLRLLRERTEIETADDRVILKLTDHALYQYPMLYLVGHGNIRLTEQEVTALRQYLTNGGFLFVNDDYGLDKSFRREISRVFPKQELQPIPNSHPIYHCFYDLPGLPKIHEHDSEPAQGFGIFHDGRMVLFYAYSADIGDGLEDPRVHPDDTPEVRELATKMAVNIAVYVLTH